MTFSCHDLTLIIPIFNAEKTLSLSLASLKAQTLVPGKIIFVDNASTDSSWLLLESFKKEFTGCDVFLLHEDKPGPSAARNRAIQTADTPLLGFIDSDMSLHPQWTQGVVDFFNAHPDIDAVAGVTQGYSTPDVFQNFQSFYRKDFKSTVLTRWPDVFSQGFLTFANAACRSSFFDRAGLLPEEYAVGEDLYLNIQALRHGAAIKISEPTLVSYHYEKYTLATFLQSRYRYRLAMARVIHDLLPQTLIFRKGSSRPFPINAWIGNPVWMLGAGLVLALMMIQPLWGFSLPLWAYGFNLLHVMLRRRSCFVSASRVWIYAAWQTVVMVVLLMAQANAWLKYRVIMI